MKVRLNLATAPLASNRRFAAGAALVGTIALLALIGLSWRAYQTWSIDLDYRTKMSRQNREMDELRRRRRDVEVFFNRPDIVKVRDRAAFINGLIEQRSFPWTKIFMDLEKLLPAGVRVVSISPRMNAGRVEVKLTVGAISDDGKLKFLRALEASKAFSHIQLTGEQHPTSIERNDQVVLELTALYSTAST